MAVRVVVWLISWVVDLQAATWDDTLIEGLDYISNSVLQAPFLLMTLMSYVTPTLDEMYDFVFFYLYLYLYLLL